MQIEVFKRELLLPITVEIHRYPFGYHWQAEMLWREKNIRRKSCLTRELLSECVKDVSHDLGESFGKSDILVAKEFTRTVYNLPEQEK